MTFGSEILAMIKRIKGLEPERRTLCPVCEYELSEKNGILCCEFCGWSEK